VSAVRPDAAAAATTVATAWVGRRPHGAATSARQGRRWQWRQRRHRCCAGCGAAGGGGCDAYRSHPPDGSGGAGGRGGGEADRPPPPPSVAERAPAPVRRHAERLRCRGAMRATVDVGKRPEAGIASNSGRRHVAAGGGGVCVTRWSWRQHVRRQAAPADGGGERPRPGTKGQHGRERGGDRHEEQADRCTSAAPWPWRAWPRRTPPIGPGGVPAWHEGGKVRALSPRHGCWLPHVAHTGLLQLGAGVSGPLLDVF